MSHSLISNARTVVWGGGKDIIIPAQADGNLMRLSASKGLRQRTQPAHALMRNPMLYATIVVQRG